MAARTPSLAARRSTKIPLVDRRSSQKDRKGYCGIVEVLVGQDEKQQKFHVHEQLLTTGSLFFRKAMSGNWSEAKDRIVRLPEDDPLLFHIYVDLLYTNQIAVIPDSSSREATIADRQNARAIQNTLAMLYILVEKLQDIDSKDKTIAAMVASMHEKRSDGGMYSPGHMIVQTVYNGTPPGCLLRKLIVDLYTSKATQFWVSNAHEFPDEFVRELMINVVTERSGVPGLIDVADLTAYMEDTVTKKS
ncbi:hypothetical protein ST47_g3850 [Ascochyta rabiei]|uniref:Uncharacterized protein n=1 Tax=Didymella rabiei TaxID=5454 RepID=A0A163GTS8_DIDRA|nr:hypothetical protein ST47_g3850 [Ascochyta rabiei]